MKKKEGIWMVRCRDTQFLDIVDFIKALYRTKDFIPLHFPSFQGNEKKHLMECIDSTYVSTVGKFVGEFEEQLTKATSSARAVACVNGSCALNLALRIVGVERNDEVLTQSLSFVATSNAITISGALPVFIDVDRDTLGMSPESLNSFLVNNSFSKGGKLYNKKTNRRIVACLPMHTFGHACRIEEIAKICADFNIELIEDAAEALGSKYKNKALGTFGKLGILSFNGNKIITTGGGGAIVTNDEMLAEKAKHLSLQAKLPHDWEFVHDQVGFNYRMPNINAALGVAQIQMLRKFVESKRDLAHKYNAYFNDQGIPFIRDRQGEKSNYWLNAIILEDKKQRDNFLKVTNTNGIMTRPIWRLLNKLPMYKNCQSTDLTNSEWLEERVVNIPSSPCL